MHGCVATLCNVNYKHTHSYIFIWHTDPIYNYGKIMFRFDVFFILLLKNSCWWFTVIVSVFVSRSVFHFKLVFSVYIYDFWTLWFGLFQNDESVAPFITYMRVDLLLDLIVSKKPNTHSHTQNYGQYKFIRNWQSV